MLKKKLVKDLFEYRDGKLYWKTRVARNVFAGDEAGFIQGNGYVGVRIGQKIYQLHRVIFLHQYGFLPAVIDHIDGNILNNSAENLRAATVATNGRNRRTGINNTSGVKNVSWSKATQKWTVMVQKDGAQHYFGRYKNLAEAAAVARQARQKLHNEFARHE